jgi:low affinity Fe/Cu permease
MAVYQATIFSSPLAPTVSPSWSEHALALGPGFYILWIFAIFTATLTFELAMFSGTVIAVVIITVIVFVLLASIFVGGAMRSTGERVGETEEERRRRRMRETEEEERRRREWQAEEERRRRRERD